MSNSTFVDATGVILARIRDKANTGGEDQLTPEQIASLAAAANELSQHENLELAVLATANGHLDAATLLMDAAKGSLDSAKATLVSAKNDLATQTANIALIPQMKTEVSDELSKIGTVVAAELIGTRNNFHLGRTADHIIYTGNSSAYYTRKPVNAVEIDNFDTGEYYCFYDYGSNTGGQSYSTLVKIDVNGKVTTALSAARTVSNGFMRFVAMDDSTARLVHLNGSTVKILNEAAHSWALTETLDYGKVYQRKSTKELVGVKDGFIMTMSIVNGKVPNGDIAFANQGLFEVWADADSDLVSIDTEMATYWDSSQPLVNNIYNTGYSPHKAVENGSVPVIQHRMVIRDGEYVKLPILTTSLWTCSGKAPMQNGSGSTSVPTHWIASNAVPVENDAIDRMRMEFVFANTQYTTISGTVQMPNIQGYSSQHKAVIFSLGYSSHEITSSQVYQHVNGVSFGK